MAPAKKKPVPTEAPAAAPEVAEEVKAPVSEVVAYIPFYAQLAELEKQNAGLVFDYESKVGNKEARSHIYKLRQTKGAIEKVREEAKADALRIGRAVDSEAAAIKARVEAMIAVHQQKIDEIEKREKDRVAALENAISAIANFAHSASTGESISAAISDLSDIVIDDRFQEMRMAAEQAKAKRMTELEDLLDATHKREAEQRELAELRAKTAEQERIAREKEVADNAAKQAREEAEERGRQAKEAADRRAAEAQVQADNARRQAADAEERAAQAKRDADAKAEQAVQAERQRAQEQQAEAQKAAAARSADEEHRATYNRAALDAMKEHGIEEAAAKRCIALIIKGMVPNVSMNY